MAKVTLEKALGGYIDVLVNLIVLDARGVPYEATFNAYQRMPKKAVIEMGQQFNYPLLAEENGEVQNKLKAIVTDLPQKQIDGVTMVATIMDEAQVAIIKADPNKESLASTIMTSVKPFNDLIDMFKKGNPEFKELNRRYI